MMMLDDIRPAEDPRALRLRFYLDVYMRALAAVLLVMGVVHWTIILGVFSDPAWQFEAMRNNWKASTMILAVADLVAAVGLWMRVGWGDVMWIFAALFEIVIHTAFRKTYGLAIPLVAFHVLSLVAYAGLVIAERRARRDGGI